MTLILLLGVSVEIEWYQLKHYFHWNVEFEYSIVDVLWL